MHMNCGFVHFCYFVLSKKFNKTVLYHPNPTNNFLLFNVNSLIFKVRCMATSGEMSYRRQDVGVSSKASKLRKVLFYANVERLPMGMKTAGLVSLADDVVEVQQDAREVNLRCEQ